MPHEFWREVVDRIAVEAPDTLLMAEAFWMMEGYFVRTLGMHRVYNSAFMHMLRDEENAKYRQLIKNTLEFDPQILKRHVNFMSNPDEETAIDQFGTGDKYFGVCTVMATLPGLPMFAHGQMDGLRERYGMEYRRAKMDEQPDEAVLGMHEQRIFPLLRNRGLFAEVDDFHLFDLVARGGKVNENVLAYSNRRGDERALVLYNNKRTSTRGWVRDAAPALDQESGKLRRESLAEALSLPRTGFVVFRDHVTHLEYVLRLRRIVGEGTPRRAGSVPTPGPPRLEGRAGLRLGGCKPGPQWRGRGTRYGACWKGSASGQPWWTRRAPQPLGGGNQLRRTPPRRGQRRRRARPVGPHSQDRAQETGSQKAIPMTPRKGVFTGACMNEV